MFMLIARIFASLFLCSHQDATTTEDEKNIFATDSANNPGYDFEFMFKIYKLLFA